MQPDKNELLSRMICNFGIICTLIFISSFRVATFTPPGLHHSRLTCGLCAALTYNCVILHFIENNRVILDNDVQPAASPPRTSLPPPHSRQHRGTQLTGLQVGGEGVLNEQIT